MPVTGLTRVTVSAARRRLDVALPEQAPLAELLPELLRHAGEGLPDAGQTHGGWVLRRTDGAALSVGQTLAQQGVRDGEVLTLVPARDGWPELEYDDVADAIASSARRYGRAWDGAATRLTGLAVCAGAALLGAVSLLRWPSAPIALGIAGLLVVLGILASRGYGDGAAGATIAALALPYAFVAGLPSVLPASAAVVLVGVVGAVGVGYGLRVFIGAVTAGLLGVLGAVLAFWLPAPGAAAAVVAVEVTGMAAVPLLAIRLGGLSTTTIERRPAGPAQVPAHDVSRAVARTDELVTGALLGFTAAGLAASAIAVKGGVSGAVLVAVAALGFLLRARLFPTVRQRLPLLVAGFGAVPVLLASLALPRYWVTAVLVALALVAVLTGAVYRRRAPGPYLGRAADVLDALCVTSVIPLACAVLGLYGRMRGLIN
jgi:type VII secretion integral membrane protein EccD